MKLNSFLNILIHCSALQVVQVGLRGTGWAHGDIHWGREKVTFFSSTRAAKVLCRRGTKNISFVVLDISMVVFYISLVAFDISLIAFDNSLVVLDISLFVFTLAWSFLTLAWSFLTLAWSFWTLACRL
jgi:hypothetical protein